MTNNIVPAKKPARAPKTPAISPEEVAVIDQEQAEKTQIVYDMLEDEYGHRRWRKHREPLDELILTILSQNTSDINSGRAFDSLTQTFRGWEDVLDAPTDLVADVIRHGGLANIKAPRIQEVLAEVKRRRGNFDLDFLADMPLNEARAWLNSLNGVGPKTTACVLVFSLGMPALPVDTHVHRVSQRIGLIGPKINAEQAHLILERRLQGEQVYSFHINMITHGRRVCKAPKPLCERCPLTDYCDYFRNLQPIQPLPAGARPKVVPITTAHGNLLAEDEL